MTGDAASRWQSLVRTFKEALARRLWALPSLSETEKELAFRELLTDLDGLERELTAYERDAASGERKSSEENELLRSLLGVPGEDLRTRVVAANQERDLLQERVQRLEEEAEALRKKTAETTEENDELRKSIRDAESEGDTIRVQQMKLREDDIRFFSEEHEGLKNQLKELESRLTNLRHLFAQTNQKMVTEKQEEISLLQRRLLEEMESALRRKQELSWNEEEMFAKGVAHRVRTALVSAQGQLMLTLERLGLLDPQTRNEAFWRTRIRLMMEGAEALSDNFRAIQRQLQDVTSTLDDYLHLTHRREINREPVSIKDLVQAEMADIYAERRPTLSVEFLSDDPLPDVTGDPSLLKFIVRELLKNAMEALPNGAGQVSIALKNAAAERRIRMLVKDSGRGIPESMLGRLFEPFFTTKEHRQGLSLSRARRYAEFHGGTLSLVKTGTAGTTFQLEIPLETSDAEREDLRLAAPGAETRAEER